VTAAAAREDGRPRGRLDRRAVIVLGAVFVLALVFSQSCQQAQVRVSQRQAIATAREQVSFTPERTQIRLVRQGLESKPFWAISLSIPARDGAQARVATVRIDANTGKVEAVNDSGRPG
jgi:hypothetical protein